jgi:hypothetical protein
MKLENMVSLPALVDTTIIMGYDPNTGYPISISASEFKTYLQNLNALTQATVEINFVSGSAQQFSIALPEVFDFLQISATNPVRFRLYSTQAYQIADASRGITPNATKANNIICDINLIAGELTQIGNPPFTCFSSNGTYYYTIDSTNSGTITITYLPL